MMMIQYPVGCFLLHRRCFK